MFDRKAIIAVDPITFEILRNRLAAINDEAALTLRLVSGSPVANEAYDMNTGLMNAHGEVFVMGIYIGIHTMSLSMVIKDILQEYQENPGINPDDMFICNDPYVGSCHQMDVVVVAPIHWEGELVAWTGATVHQIDLGGPVEGQVQVGAKDIYGEQPIMPPVKIVEGGVVRKDIEREYLRRSRLVRLTGLDLKAKIAANNVAKRQVRELIERYGLLTFKETVQQTIDDAEQRFRSRLKGLPNGRWRHRSYIDYVDKVYTICLAMTKEEDALTFDYSETDPQAPAVINCTRPALMGGTVDAILPYLCYDYGWCPGGIMKAVSVVSKPGTVVHAQWPAGCSKATTTGSYHATKVASVCLAKMLAASDEYRHRLMATWMGGVTVEELFGIDQRGQYFGGTILDGMAGGSGAWSYQDGIDSGGFLDSPSSIIANVEDYELNYPILYLYRRHQKDSGGPGKFRGGATVSMMYITHDVERIPTKIMHATGVEQPEAVGIFGGYPSSTTQFMIKRKTDVRELLARGIIPEELEEVQGHLEVYPSIAATSLDKNDVYRCVASGGGGYGDPLERAPDLVVRDVINGLVSYECARDIYGVVMDRAEERYDAEATAKRREEIREERKKAGRLAGKI